MWDAKTSILSFQKERRGPIESLELKVGAPHTYTLHPSIPTLQVEASEKEGCVRRRRNSWGRGVWVLDRAGEGRWWGVLGLSRG